MLRRSARLLVAAAVVGAAIGAGVGILGDRPPTDVPVPVVYYAATHTFGLDTETAAEVSSTQLSTLPSIGQFATTIPVTTEVAKQLGGDGAALAQRITTTVAPNSPTLELTAVAATPDRAVELADTFASAVLTVAEQQLIAQAAEQSLQLATRLDDLKARRVVVEEQLRAPGLSTVDRDTFEAQRDALVNQYRIAYDRFIGLGDGESVAMPLYSLQRAKGEPIDEAEYLAALERGRTGTNHITGGDPTATPAPAASGASSVGLPSGPVALGIVGALVGLVVGIGIVLLRSRFDSRMYTRAEFEEAFALPILGGVPLLHRRESSAHSVTVLEKPFSPAAEVYRAVRSALLLMGTDFPNRDGALVVMVGSSQPKEGKSTCSANIAAAFAEAGRSTLVVNCDYRRPTLHRFFGVENVAGEIVATATDGLSLVTDVVDAEMSPGQVALAQRAFVESQRRNFDVIVLDTAPLLSTSDPIDVVSVADLVLLVGRPGVTNRDHARQCVELLERHRARLGGLLMMAVESVGNDYYDYYSAYSSYASSDTASNARRADGSHDAERRRRGLRRRRRDRRDRRDGVPAPSEAGADVPVDVHAAAVPESNGNGSVVKTNGALPSLRWTAGNGSAAGSVHEPPGDLR